ncbi:regulatory protein ArsR [Natrinema pallidum DSM 3751]|uniref:Regulatory protein ArsR n=1 Tax=Natrinema pallidum DSM 3751 TaxID=1227495 RepID=L9YZZ8_9EURY|nr:hypothetical protein [Natrinema pallidum]ELY79840.1 regulatory protein ArsR [Natrinema pallidum DSM 3751]
MARDLAPDIAALVADLETNHGDTLERIADGMAPCEHCRSQKYETYLLLTILRRAFVAGTLRDDPGQ